MGLLILEISALITTITSVTVAAISLTQHVHTAQYVKGMSRNVSLALATQEIIDRKLKLKVDARDFPGGPVAKTPHSQCRGPRFDAWSGN